MLAGTAGLGGGGSIQQQIKAIFCHFSSVLVKKTNCRRMLKLIIFRIYFSLLFSFFFCLHQIEQTYNGTCKVNTLWCFSLPSKSNWTKTWYLFLYSEHENTLKYIQKKIYTYNAHQSNIIIICDWSVLLKQNSGCCRARCSKLLNQLQEREARKKIT